MSRPYTVKTRTIGEVEMYPMPSKPAWKSVAYANVDSTIFVRTQTGCVFSSFLRRGGVYLQRCSPGQEATLLEGLMLVGAIDKRAYRERAAELRQHAKRVQAARDADYHGRGMSSVPGFKFTAEQKRFLAALAKANGND